MSQRATDEGAGRTVRDRGLPLLARAYPTSSCISVMDDYAAHKRAEVRDWLAANPRIIVHFTSTSWLNLVEVWFCIGG